MIHLNYTDGQVQFRAFTVKRSSAGSASNVPKTYLHHDTQINEEQIIFILARRFRGMVGLQSEALSAVARGRIAY